MTVCNKLIPLTVFFVSLQGLVAAEPLTLEYSEAKLGGITLKQVDKETLKPFTGEYNPGVDASTLYGKVICGYQGWFRCRAMEPEWVGLIGHLRIKYLNREISEPIYGPTPANWMTTKNMPRRSSRKMALLITFIVL